MKFINECSCIVDYSILEKAIMIPVKSVIEIVKAGVNA